VSCSWTEDYSHFHVHGDSAVRERVRAAAEVPHRALLGSPRFGKQAPFAHRTQASPDAGGVCRFNRRHQRRTPSQRLSSLGGPVAQDLRLRRVAVSPMQRSHAPARHRHRAACPEGSDRPYSVPFTPTR
jgi:hypothetical protein